MKFIKEILFAVVIMTNIFIMSCGNSAGNNDADNNTSTEKGYPIIKFDTTYYDFGTLVQGEQAAFTFKFKNTGTSELIIFDAFSTCGCTVPEFSSEPIQPGGEGKIEVIFNSEGKRGLQYKSVVLKLNTVINEKTLTIKANVLEK